MRAFPDGGVTITAIRGRFVMKTVAKIGLYRYGSTLIVAFFLWINLLSFNSVFPATIYSGTQNLSLESILNTTQLLLIDLAGDSTGSWDNLQLSITSTPFGSGSVGANDAFFGAEVALASSVSNLPLVERLDFGDSYPVNPVFASGSVILWQFNPAAGLDRGEFRDVTGYAALQFGTFGGGPSYFGWIQLNVENYNSLSRPSPR